MAVRNIALAGNPALKAENKKISNFKSKSLEKLIQDLKDTQYDIGLVGIAGPQIAENFAVFLTHPRNTALRKVSKEDSCRVYINPEIVWHSEETVLVYEGCGSLPDIFGPVIRAKAVKVRAYDENGRKFSLTTDGLLARVIQHEVDHLKGIEFIERVSDYNKVIMHTYYVKNIKGSDEEMKSSEITHIDYKLISS